MTQAHLARPRLIFGVATLLGVLSTLQAYQFVGLFEEPPQPFTHLLAVNMAFWYAWGLLAPIVLWLARRFPLERGVWRRSLLVHLVAVVGLTFAHVVLYQAAWSLLVPTALKYPWWTRVLRSYAWNFDWEMAIYFGLVGFSHASRYYREIQERRVRGAQLETRLAQAQFEALQRQLHPHFLFNTLNAISALMHRDVDAADEMLARLSDLLRMALDRRGVQEISLKDELEFLGKYLEIEQTRFGERLTVSYDIDPDALDARVPNLLLQPLVENSIRHAVGATIEPRRIDVSARCRGDRLLLEVRDDGPGLSAERPPSAKKGLGLANTRARLEQLYGSNQQLQLTEPESGGLLVTIDIPLRLEQPETLVEAVEGVA
jgi:signal transduction histidine kinase